MDKAPRGLLSPRPPSLVHEEPPPVLRGAPAEVSKIIHKHKKPIEETTLQYETS